MSVDFKHMKETYWDGTDTAMCLWEAFLTDVPEARIPHLHEFREGNGTCETRYMVATVLAPVANYIYSQLTDAERDKIGPFDWEYCPAFLEAADPHLWELMELSQFYSKPEPFHVITPDTSVSG